MKYKRSSIQLIRSTAPIHNGLCLLLYLSHSLCLAMESHHYQCRTALCCRSSSHFVWAMSRLHAAYMCTHQQRSVCGVTVAIYANNDKGKVLDFDYYYRYSYLSFLGYCYTVLHRKSFSMTKARSKPTLSH